MISIIIPAFNEEGNIKPIKKEIDKYLKGKKYEIIFIDDGSYDDTLVRLEELSKKDNRVKWLSFSRNFGHQIALKAGIDSAKGDCVISMDADLQHPPHLIPRMIEKWKEGYDIVYTIRKSENKNKSFKNITSVLFYKIMTKISGLEIPEGAADFRLIDRKVADVVKKFNENDVFLRGLFFWLGFSSVGISYSPQKRFSGKTKYSLRKMIKLAITGITSFSVRPLRLATYLGSFISIVAFFYGVYAIAIRIFTKQAILGWSSLLASILFLGGVQLLMLGIIGEYLGKLFIESKKRPNYIIKKKKI
jgi:dolichol-phosphate mannosyltransferase